MGSKDNHCPFHDSVIRKYILGDISPADDRRLREHVPGCPLCRQDIDRITRYNRLLAREALPELSAGFTTGLMKRIRELDGHTPLKTGGPLIGLRAAAAIVIICVSSLLMLGTLIKSMRESSDTESSAGMDYEITKGGGEVDVGRLIHGSVRQFLADNGIDRNTISVNMMASRDDRDRKDDEFKDAIALKKGGHRMSKADIISTPRKTAVITISSTPWGIYRLNKEKDRLDENLRDEYDENIKLVLAADMPFQIFEGWNLVFFLLFVSLEILVRILLVYSIRKNRVYGRFTYPAAIILGSVFIPVYLILLRRLKHLR